MEPELPESAVRAFERATGLSVVLHAPHDHRAIRLPEQRFLHARPVCAAAKAVARQRCLASDGERVAIATSSPGGGAWCKCCHAGIVEWVAGVPAGAGRWWRLFAGQRRPGPDLVVDIGEPAVAGAWSAAVAALPPVGAEESAWIAELLAQLAARLAGWLAERPGAGVALPAPDRDRAAQIRRFLHERHQRPLRLGDLARHLGLSETRAGHAVRESCGTSFVALLAEQRLASAVALLGETGLGVSEVARASGFPDPARFHRLFRRRYGCTPAAFRRRCSAGEV